MENVKIIGIKLEGDGINGQIHFDNGAKLDLDISPRKPSISTCIGLIPDYDSSRKLLEWANRLLAFKVIVDLYPENEMEHYTDECLEYWIYLTDGEITELLTKYPRL